MGKSINYFMNVFGDSFFFFFFTKMCSLKRGQFNPAELLTAENACLVLTVYGLRLLKIRFYSSEHTYSEKGMEGKMSKWGTLGRFANTLILLFLD